MTGEHTFQHIGWAVATAGMRIAASITYIGVFALVGRVIGAVEVHPALSPVIWVSAVVAVGMVYSALVSSRIPTPARRVRAAVALAAVAIMLIRAFQIVSGPILIAIVGVGVVSGIVSLALLFVETPRFDAA